MMFAARSVSEAEKSLVLVAIDAWKSMLHDAKELRQRKEKVKQQSLSQANCLISNNESSLLKHLFLEWHSHSSETIRERNIASAREQASNFKLRAKQQKLQAMDLAQTELEHASLLTYLLRWAQEAKSLSLKSTKKDQSMAKGMAAITSSETMVLEFCFSTWLKEAREQRKKRSEKDQNMARCLQTIANSDAALLALCFSMLVEEAQSLRREHLDRRLDRAAVSHKKTILALERSLNDGQEMLKASVTRAWHQVAHARRRQKRQAHSSTMRNFGAAQAYLMSATLAMWAMLTRQSHAITTVIMRESEALARLSRVMTLGRNMSLKMRTKLLLIQVVRGWQHAFCYEELLRILGHTQVDLAKVAEAAALAESAAALAARKNDVTVRLLPSNSEQPRWPISHVPSTGSLNMPQESLQFTAEIVESNFQAPVISLQKDIQRHYSSYQRPIDRFRARPRPQSAGMRRIQQDVHNAVEVASEVSEDNYRQRMNQSRSAWG